MKITINNKEVETQSTHLGLLATELALPPQGVALAVNNRMVPRTAWEDTPVEEGMQPGDLLLLISNSGKTREIVELTQLAHNLNPDLKFIVITGNPDSPLAREATVCLPTGSPKEVCALGMTPTTSTTVMTVIGDILVVQTMKQTGFTIEDYSKRHHGGYLGEKSRELCEK